MNNWLFNTSIYELFTSEWIIDWTICLLVEKKIPSSTLGKPGYLVKWTIHVIQIHLHSIAAEIQRAIPPPDLLMIVYKYIYIHKKNNIIIISLIIYIYIIYMVSIQLLCPRANVNWTSNEYWVWSKYIRHILLWMGYSWLCLETSENLQLTLEERRSPTGSLG